jgi:Zn-dependent protease
VASRAAVFKVFGFPVHVQPGFVFFMVLVIYVQGVSFGLPFAVFIALFTLLHELGHAFAARATGAEAQISLNFMAGYASFTPTRELSKLERAGISFAGPGIQILVGGLVYLALRGQFAWPEAGKPLQYAVMWAGPIIGLFNLIPVIPFDGGNIAQIVIEVFAPKQARRIMIGFTLTLTAAAFVFMALNPNLMRYVFFAIVPLLAVAATLSSESSQRKAEEAQRSRARAEALAWATGALQFAEGAVPSPWYRAWQQVQSHHPEVARDVILADFVDPQPPKWNPPDAAPDLALSQLVAALPRPLPQGRAYSTYVLSSVLLRLRLHQEAAFYAAAAHAVHRSPMFAVHVARAAAALGDRGTALGWLRTAVNQLPPDASIEAITSANEFEQLRHDPGFAAAVSR